MSWKTDLSLLSLPFSAHFYAKYGRAATPLFRFPQTPPAHTIMQKQLRQAKNKGYHNYLQAWYSRSTASSIRLSSILE